MPHRRDIRTLACDKEFPKKFTFLKLEEYHFHPKILARAHILLMQPLETYCPHQYQQAHTGPTVLSLLLA